jgi:hypothetical protein
VQGIPDRFGKAILLVLQKKTGNASDSDETGEKSGGFFVSFPGASYQIGSSSEV